MKTDYREFPVCQNRDLEKNAVVFADVLNDERHIEEIRRLTAGTPEAALLVERLIDRKRPSLPMTSD
ncbi:MAG: hypothetical protein ACRD7E_04860 [Bryobacteraceae bacterium]